MEEKDAIIDKLRASRRGKRPAPIFFHLQKGSLEDSCQFGGVQMTGVKSLRFGKCLYIPLEEVLKQGTLLSYFTGVTTHVIFPYAGIVFDKLSAQRLISARITAATNTGHLLRCPPQFPPEQTPLIYPLKTPQGAALKVHGSGLYLDLVVICKPSQYTLAMEAIEEARLYPTNEARITASRAAQFLLNDVFPTIVVTMKDQFSFRLYPHAANDASSLCGGFTCEDPLDFETPPAYVMENPWVVDVRRHCSWTVLGMAARFVVRFKKEPSNVTLSGHGGGVSFVRWGLSDDDTDTGSIMVPEPKPGKNHFCPLPRAR